MIPQTVGQKFDVGKVARIQCVKNATLKDLEIKEHNLSKMIMQETDDATVILISHRLSAVKSADKILFVENGTVVECGSHSELMKPNGKYYEMYNIQAEGYLDD